MAEEKKTHKKSKKKKRHIFRNIILFMIVFVLWFEIPVTEEIHIDDGGNEQEQPARFALVTDLHHWFYNLYTK